MAPPHARGESPSFGARLLRLHRPTLQGSDVAILQSLCNRLHDLLETADVWDETLVVDGVFGRVTRQVVMGVQSAFGLPEDGMAGPGTYRIFGHGVGVFTPYRGPAFGSRPLSEGDRGGDVLVLQNRLNALGYARVLGSPATGEYEPTTTRALRLFQGDVQRRHGLPCGTDGQLDMDTATALLRLSAAGGRNLAEGSFGLDVAWLQTQLVRATGPDVPPPYGGAVDGLFGRQTAEALRQWQTVQGLPNDGIAGPEAFFLLGSQQIAR